MLPYFLYRLKVGGCFTNLLKAIILANTVRLQKTSGEPGTPPKPSVRNSPVKTPVPQTAKPSLPQAAVSHPAASLTAAAGLPVDKLSASIISFTRFFSLHLKPELLAAIRRQAVALPSSQAAVPAQPQSNWLKPAAQAMAAEVQAALSLAAAAAESKGVRLSPEGLEAFATAIDPDRRSRQDSGDGDRRKRRDDPVEAEKENSHKALSGSGLRETVLESSEKKTLLAVLNRLPGKNGQRWIVLPFSFNGYGKELQVSMRILFEGETPETGHVCQMVLDIASEKGGERCLFSMKRSSGGEVKMTVFLEDNLSPPSPAYIRELSLHTGIPPDCIAVQYRKEKFPCERRPGDDLLRSINELV